MLRSSAHKSWIRKRLNHLKTPHPRLHDDPDNPGSDRRRNGQTSGEWNSLIYPHLPKYSGSTVPSAVSEAQQIDMVVLNTGLNELGDAVPLDEPQNLLWPKVI